MAAEMPDKQEPASAYCVPSCKSVLVLNALMQLSRIIVCLLCDKASFSKLTPVHWAEITTTRFSFSSFHKCLLTEVDFCSSMQHADRGKEKKVFDYYMKNILIKTYVNIKHLRIRERKHALQPFQLFLVSRELSWDTLCSIHSLELLTVPVWS